MDRIVVGVDGTPESLAAAHYAAGLARKMGFTLTLAFVVPIFAPLGPEEALGQRAEWEREEEQRGSKMLLEIAAACELPAGRIERLVLHGDAATELANAARTSVMAVVGHRARGAVARALLGSVADRLAQLSTVPLLVVPKARSAAAI